MPFAWVIGRLGCALAHEHIGLPSHSWLVVKFPGGSYYDLGLIEFLFLIVLSASFYWLDRKPRPVGFFLGLYAFVHGAFRIRLDTLHLQPMRFYAGAAGCLIGMGAWIIMARTRGLSEAVIPAQLSAAGTVRTASYGDGAFRACVSTQCS